MKQRNEWQIRLAVVALAIVSLPAASAVITCATEPSYSIITEGETVQLSVNCSGGTVPLTPVSAVNWKMGGVSVTGDIDVSSYSAGELISYTTPVSAGIGNGIQVFTVDVTPTDAINDTVSTIKPMRVVVKPSSAAVAVAAGLSNPTAPTQAACGEAIQSAAASTPATNTLCQAGSKSALMISGPDAFTWSCLSLTGGNEVSCYALRGFNVLAVEGSNPNEGSITSTHPQAVANGATGNVSVNMTNAAYSPQFVSSCGGTQAGNNFTTGPVTGSNCTVTVNYNNTPINGVCGSADTIYEAAGSPSQPGQNMCSSTSSFAEVADTELLWKWACNGNGVSTATNAPCDAPKQYNVTATPGANGKVDGSASAVVKEVKAGSPTSFNIVADPGYGISSVTGCSGVLSGSTYTTSSITSVCSVSATFAQQVVSSTDTGVGLWVPTPANNTWIADQSGPSNGTSSYVPGCLNGVFPPTASSSGCGGVASYTGAISGSGTTTTVAFGSGKTLGLRYVSKSTAGAAIKYLSLTSGDGGNVGQLLNVWLSTSPTATFAETDAKCKTSTTTRPYIVTGPAYCPITPNARYYLKMSTDQACSTCRYIVNKGSSDFN